MVGYAPPSGNPASTFKRSVGAKPCCVTGKPCYSSFPLYCLATRAYYNYQFVSHYPRYSAMDPQEPTCDAMKAGSLQLQEVTDRLIVPLTDASGYR